MGRRFEASFPYQSTCHGKDKVNYVVATVVGEPFVYVEWEKGKKVWKGYNVDMLKDMAGGKSSLVVFRRQMS